MHDSDLMLDGMGEYACELGLVLRRNEEGCRHEQVAARKSGRHARRAAQLAAVIAGYRSEGKWRPRVQHLRRQPLTQAIEIRLNGRIIERRSVLAKIGGHYAAERNFLI